MLRETALHQRADGARETRDAALWFEEADGALPEGRAAARIEAFDPAPGQPGRPEVGAMAA